MALSALGALALSGPSSAGDAWSHYENARYAYSVEIPPGFSAVREADNGDGGVSTSSVDGAELLVWGNQILEPSFAADVKARISMDRDDGWNISYESRKPQSASWSGSKDGRIFYQRVIAGCDATMINFRLTYAQTKLKAYNAVIGRLVKSLRSGC